MSHFNIAGFKDNVHPHISNKFEVTFFRNVQPIEEFHELWKFSVKSVKLPSWNIDADETRVRFGNTQYVVPIFNFGSSEMTITFVDNEGLPIYDMLNSLLIPDERRFWAGWRPGEVRIKITEFTNYDEIFSSHQYLVLLTGVSQPSFSLGSPNAVEITATFNIIYELNSDDIDEAGVILAKQPITDIPTEKVYKQRIEAAQKEENKFANSLKAQLDVPVVEARPNGSKGDAGVGEMTGEMATSKQANGTVVIDILGVDSPKQNNKTGFHSSGTGYATPPESVTLTPVIHKVGCITKGTYSANAAFSGFAYQGVAAFAVNGTIYLNMDRIYDNHNAASGTGSVKNGFAIELGDKTIVGNAGAVIKVGDKWYANLDMGAVTAGSEASVVWKELTAAEMSDFATACGETSFEAALDKADANEGKQLVGRTTYSRTQINGEKTTLTIPENTQVYVPKLTLTQKEDLQKLGASVQIQAGTTIINWTDVVYHHGNVPGYQDAKVEGVKRSDEEGRDNLRTGTNSVRPRQ